MQMIKNKTFDEERALYAAQNLFVQDCAFDGPADGESAFKECSDITVDHCFFNLRYPFWHDNGLKLTNSEMTGLCRASLWYSENVEINDTKLHGIKALRECANIKMRGCDIISSEFGWSVRGITMEDCTASSEYFMMRAERIDFRHVHMKGKYSFQYITDSVFENCKIIGTQPLCYCKNLKLVACEMVDTDLSFERSEVEATLTAPIVSIKNPLSGCICVPEVGELIMDIENAHGEVIVGNKVCKNEPCDCCA